ncbi:MULTISPECIES: hypothetical protein [unclassified Microcoleus]|nr:MULTISPECIES: hypothetical protein [unclassified Microcoleus]
MNREDAFMREGRDGKEGKGGRAIDFRVRSQVRSEDFSPSGS